MTVKDVLMQEVQEALEEVIDGLPFAGETAVIDLKDRLPVWQRSDQWTKADFFHNFKIYSRRGNIEVAGNIARVCREKYGEAPPPYRIEP